MPYMTCSASAAPAGVTTLNSASVGSTAWASSLGLGLPSWLASSEGTVKGAPLALSSDGLAPGRASLQPSAESSTGGCPLHRMHVHPAG